MLICSVAHFQSLTHTFTAISVIIHASDHSLQSLRLLTQSLTMHFSINPLTLNFNYSKIEIMAKLTQSLTYLVNTLTHSLRHLPFVHWASRTQLTL